MADWMKFYYANPTPERFASELRAIAKSGTLENEATQIGIATFFGLLMRANPERIGDWTADLGDLTGSARKTLQMSAFLSDTSEGRSFLTRDGASPDLQRAPPDLLAKPVNQGFILDALWSHYFATGDARAVRRIISALSYLGDYGAADRFKDSQKTDLDQARAMRDAIYRAAAWSLGSLMQEHAPLRATCEQILLRATDEKLNPNEHAGLALTLEKVDPSMWKVQLDAKTGQATIIRAAPKQAPSKGNAMALWKKALLGAALLLGLPVAFVLYAVAADERRIQGAKNPCEHDCVLDSGGLEDCRKQCARHPNAYGPNVKPSDWLPEDAGVP